MKRLDKFSLLIENEEMGKEVKRIADKAGINNFRVHFASIGYYYYYENLSFQGATNYQPKENPLITFNQFKAMFEPKIIGYKCPYMILEWVIGDIFVEWPHKPYGVKEYHVKGKGKILPAGIVETWEPIYEEVNTELDNLKNEAEKLKTQLDSVMKAIEELYTKR